MKKKWITKLLSVTMATAMVLSLVACSSDSEESKETETEKEESQEQEAVEEDGQDSGELTELSFMCWSDAVPDIVEQIVEDFNAEHEGKIKVNLELVASEDTKTKLPTLMAADEAPDIFMAWSEGYLEPYVTAGKVYSLQDALDSDPEWSGQFIEALFDSTTYDGEIYAVPTALCTHVFLYNKEIYDKFNLSIPTTYEEYVDGLKVIRDSGEDIIPMALGNSEAWPAASICEALANRIGGSEIFENAVEGTAAWTDESFVTAATYMQELANENLVTPGFNGISAQEAVEQFKSGKAASLIWPPSCIPSLEADDSVVKDNVVVANCMTVEGGDGDANAWLGQADRCLAISERCENKEAAVEFIKYYTQVKYMQQILDAGNISSLKGDLFDLSNLGPINSQLVEASSEMTELFVYYDVVLGSTVGNEFNNTVQSVMAGEDAQVAFENFQEFFDTNYEK